MYFPWVGFLEMIQLSDCFVHYDDVQFSKGSFTNRVQIKTSKGTKWLTIPLGKHHLGQSIKETKPNDNINWQNQHLELLFQSYRDAPFYKEMLHLVERVFANSGKNISDIAKTSVIFLCDYFNLSKHTVFKDSSSLNVSGTSSERVYKIVNFLKGTIYLSGHGALKYLDFDLFESSGIKVKLMQYSCSPYHQLHGEFTPFVSSLDLIANCGKSGLDQINPKAIYWKDFQHG